MGCGGSRVVYHSDKDVVHPSLAMKEEESLPPYSREDDCQIDGEEQKSPSILQDASTVSSTAVVEHITVGISSSACGSPSTSGRHMQVVGVKQPDKEVMKFDPQSKSLKRDEAAIKIQAGIRGYQTRKQLKEQKKKKKAELIKREKAATKIQAGARGYKTRKDIKEKKIRRAKEDKAATKIQAGVRGYRTRKEVKARKQRKAKEEKAATKIQAGVRGYKTRKELKAKKLAAEKDAGNNDIDKAEETIEDGASACAEEKSQVRKNSAADDNDDVFERPPTGVEESSTKEDAIDVTSKPTAGATEQDGEL